MTDFPPPAGFTGHQSCDCGDPDSDYKRECTPEEVAILEADVAASRAGALAEEEALRDQWFALLKEEQGVDAPGAEEQPAGGRRSGQGESQ